MKPLYPQALEYMHVVSELLEVPCIVTEKLLGRHFEYTVQRMPDSNAHNHVAETEAHELALANRIGFALGEMLDKAHPNTQKITVYGVIIGPYDEAIFPHYALSEKRLLLYDLTVDDVDIGGRYAFCLFDGFSLPHVPVLSTPGMTLGEYLKDRPVNYPAKTRLGHGTRYGIVIRPDEPLTHPDVGNVILAV